MQKNRLNQKAFLVAIILIFEYRKFLYNYELIPSFIEVIHISI